MIKGLFCLGKLQKKRKIMMVLFCCPQCLPCLRDKYSAARLTREQFPRFLFRSIILDVCSVSENALSKKETEQVRLV